MRYQTPGKIWVLWDFFGLEIAAYDLADEEKESSLLLTIMMDCLKHLFLAGFHTYFQKGS